MANSSEFIFNALEWERPSTPKTTYVYFFYTQWESYYDREFIKIGCSSEPKKLQARSQDVPSKRYLNADFLAVIPLDSEADAVSLRDHLYNRFRALEAFPGSTGFYKIEGELLELLLWLGVTDLRIVNKRKTGGLLV